MEDALILYAKLKKEIQNGLVGGSCDVDLTPYRTAEAQDVIDRQKFSASGHPVNKTLGTDENGNVITIENVDLTPYRTAEVQDVIDEEIIQNAVKFTEAGELEEVVNPAQQWIEAIDIKGNEVLNSIPESNPQTMQDIARLLAFMDNIENELEVYQVLDEETQDLTFRIRRKVVTTNGSV